ncbi:MAG: hypothetical protein JSV93_01610 [Candidatus Omnitrophota bacterium]|nr:MAG: hypothetical protein JSV93_01610 [Candidatus Omnitrophota bacterium]
MYKINLTERIGNRSNENLPTWYKEKVKVMAEIIVKKKLSETFEIASSTFGFVDTEKLFELGGQIFNRLEY